MINADARRYEYLLYGDKNAYGQPTLSEEVQGSVLMSIYTSSQNVQDNINYKDCSYVGLTTEPINDKYVVLYGNEKLKVLYVNSQGRFKQVFLKNI